MNLSTLSPSDFESLAADILSTALGVRFERFGEGRDGGIDCQYQHITEQGEERWIGQAKRYKDAQVLIRQMKAEQAKMHKLPQQPARYFLVTSCSLLPAHKAQIMAIMSPYVLSTGDIYGAEDIKALLDKDRQLYARHHRLWLHSVEQLNFELNAASYRRSQSALEIAFASAQHFVEQPQVAAVQQRLDTGHSCLIVGDPGSGKTTTAAAIALRQVIAEPDLEVHWFADRSFDQALNLLCDAEGSKQLFVLDDCFGATFLTDERALKQRQDWTALVRRAKLSGGALRLILTTRDYILQQAVRQMGTPDGAVAVLVPDAVRLDANDARFRIDFTLQSLERAGLSRAALQHLVDEQLYWPMITDPRFSPRMLELLCNQLSAVQPDQLNSFIRTSLANPDNLWRVVYERLSPEAQTLVTLVGISPDYCDSNAVLTGFLQLFHQLQGRLATTGQFEKALLEAEPVFIKSRAEHGVIWLSVANPGVHDFVYRELNANRPLVDSVIRCLPLFRWGIDSFAIQPNSHKPIRLQPAQTTELLHRLLELLPEPNAYLTQNAHSGLWEMRNQPMGQRITSLWQAVMHDKARAQWLYEQLHPLLPVGPGWAALVTKGDMAILLDLSTYADNVTQADIWSAALANLLNSEDAAALAEFYADTPTARQVLGKKKLLAKQLLSACIDEIVQINDSYHLEAILQDLYRIEAALDADIGEIKVMIYQKLEQDSQAWQDFDAGYSGVTYYNEPSLFEGHEQLLNELQGLQAEARLRAQTWLQ